MLEEQVRHLIYSIEVAKLTCCWQVPMAFSSRTRIGRISRQHPSLEPRERRLLCLYDFRRLLEAEGVQIPPVTYMGLRQGSTPMRATLVRDNN
jgi:hypothetical protein